MTGYLIFAYRPAAEARSRAAYASLNPPEPDAGATTDAVWLVLDHPSDDRAALLIPADPDGAGLGLSQAAYDALLTEDERAALVDEMPPDWLPAPA